MKRRRVVVTGLGVILPGAKGKEEFYRVLTGTKSYIRRLTRFDCTGFPSQIAAEIDGFDPGDYMDAHLARKLDRGTQYCLAASRMALHDADLGNGNLDRRTAGAVIGVAAGGYAFLEHYLATLKSQEWWTYPANFYTAMSSSNDGGMIAKELGLRGPCYTVSTGCTSGTEAIGYALQLLRSGKVDVMLAGGAEASLAPVTYGCFILIKAMSRRNADPEKACRPFDKDRDGFIMGEGSAVVVLEEMERARRRNARIYCEVAGYGTTLNAFHITGAPTTGRESALAVKKALADGGVRPDEVGYISAHGSSTWINEIAETNAFKEAFGEHAYRLAVSSTKPMTGHPMGAAGGAQAAQIALSFERDFLPPTLNLDAPSPECDLDCIPHRFRRARCRAMLQNTNGFSGKNAAVVYRRVPEFMS